MPKKKHKYRIDAKKLFTARDNKGWTQQQLSDETLKYAKSGERAIPVREISRLETERVTLPQRRTIEQIADALGIDSKALLMEIESKECKQEDSHINKNELIVQRNENLPLQDYVCSFENFITSHIEGFVGRNFVFSAIDKFVKENDCGYFLIQGDPGIGKSAIAATLVKQKGYAHHFNIAAEGINTPTIFLKNVCSQLISIYKLEYQHLPIEVSEDGRFLNKILKEISDKQGDNKAVILIDALDEADDTGLRSETNILYLPSTLPKGVFIIATSRRAQLKLRLFCSQDVFDIQADSRENLADIMAYLNNKAQNANIRSYSKKQKINANTFVEKMTEKSQGNFMYLHYILPEIEKGTYTNLDINQLPLGLENYYESHWQRMGMMFHPLPKNKIKIIYTLSEVTVPISLELLSEFCSEDPIVVQEVLQEWDQFLHKPIIKNTLLYSLYHISFRDFLRRKDIIQAAGITLKNIHQQISEKLNREFQ